MTPVKLEPAIQLFEQPKILNILDQKDNKILKKLFRNCSIQLHQSIFTFKIFDAFNCLLVTPMSNDALC